MFRGLSAEKLLAIGGFYMFFSGAIFLLFFLNQKDFVCHEVMSYFECGQYYFNNGDDPGGVYDLVKARQYFNLAVAEDPAQNKLLWYQFGRIDFLEARFDEALGKFDRQLDLFGYEVPNVYYMIALTHGYKARREGAEESWLEAEKNFQKFVEMFPKAPWSRVDLAWIYFSQGKYEAMKPVLEKGLKYDPDNAWLLNMYGLAVLNTAEDQREALVYFEQAKAEADKLTVEDWGRTYPGNDPADWPLGLAEFRSLIAKNISLSQ